MTALVRFVTACSMLMAVVFLFVGVWEHDWQIIVGALILAAIVPLLVEQEDKARRERRHERRLDRIWDDEA